MTKTSVSVPALRKDSLVDKLRAKREVKLAKRKIKSKKRVQRQDLKFERTIHKYTRKALKAFVKAYKAGFSGCGYWHRPWLWEHYDVRRIHAKLIVDFFKQSGLEVDYQPQTDGPRLEVSAISFEEWLGTDGAVAMFEKYKLRI